MRKIPKRSVSADHLEGRYIDQDEWRVVVLDFDLSWHKDALELSMLQPEAVGGYLAPEQV